MSAESIIRNLGVLWRADRLIAEIRLRRMAVGLAAGVFAALFAAFGVLMLELAAYFFLVQTWTAIVAAAILGAFNFLLAGLIVLIANIRGRNSQEQDMALALHNSAIENLRLQVRSFETARSSTHGLETILPALIVPGIRLLVNTIKRSRASAQS